MFNYSFILSDLFLCRPVFSRRGAGMLLRWIFYWDDYLAQNQPVIHFNGKSPQWWRYYPSQTTAVYSYHHLMTVIKLHIENAALRGFVVLLDLIFSLNSVI